jgi:hypothetical protein
MKSVLLFLFLTASLPFYAQHNDVLELGIDSIVTDRSHESSRQFHIYFHIRNRTGDPLSCFLNPQRLQANAVSSMANTPFYRLYQEKELLDIAYVFDGWRRRAVTERHVASEHSRDLAKDIFENVLHLPPYAVRQFCVTLEWDKQRYFREGDLEFYLDERASHYIEIAVNLLKEEYAGYLKESQLAALSADSCFIRGWYLSDKMPIDFGE